MKKYSMKDVIRDYCSGLICDCEGDELEVWRVFEFKNSLVVVFSICGVCCINSYLKVDKISLNSKLYINDKRYGFEENNFVEVEKRWNNV